ncbi:MAG TPA: protein arginine kinase [Patescibacteria group bacterium]|nr:protein arginine kinase [Patescibacteria group bacterium]
MSVIKNLLEKPARWLTDDGEENEMVLSCRVRLARNLDKRPFTHTAQPKFLSEIRDEIRSALAGTDSMKGAIYVDMDDTPESDRMVLAERRLISYELVKNFKSRALVVEPGEKMSVMVNEEDHLRLQSVEPGLSMQHAYERVDRLDDELDGRLNFAFSEKVGYLTACTTNVGTGLRVSAMVHLPGLVHKKDIQQIIDGLRHVRLTVRGTYGEGSDFMGNFFQISNTITLGLSEVDTVKNLEAHVRKVLEFEKKARNVLLDKARSLLEDKIWRAYGILKTARLLTTKEAMGLISAVRLGVGLGIITDVKLPDLNEMLIMIQPMHLQRLYSRSMAPEERDRARADYMRAKLGAGDA